MDKHIEETTLGELMTEKPLTVHPQMAIPEIKKLFEDHEFNMIPVVEEHQILLGVVTKLDLLRMFRPDDRSLIPNLRALRAEKVEDIMARDPVALEPSDPVVKAIDLMLQLNLRAIPITEKTDEGKILRGILTRKDVLQCFVFDG